MDRRTFLGGLCASGALVLFPLPLLAGKKKLLTNTQDVRVIASFEFDWRKYHLDLAFARKGATVKQMVKDAGAIYGINGSYFTVAHKGPHKGTYYSIGRSLHCSMELCTTPGPKRGMLWQDDKGVHIGYKLPQNEVFFAITAGPVFLLDGMFCPAYPESFEQRFWAESRLRSIVALREEDCTVALLKLRGKLTKIASYLKKEGFKSALNLDGGSSSETGATVANALVVQLNTEKEFEKYVKSKTWIEYLKNHKPAKP